MSGFWTIDPVTGTETHIIGDPDMTDEIVKAMTELVQQEPDPRPEWGCPFDEQF